MKMSFINASGVVWSPLAAVLALIFCDATAVAAERIFPGWQYGLVAQSDALDDDGVDSVPPKRKRAAPATVAPPPKKSLSSRCYQEVIADSCACMQFTVESDGNLSPDRCVADSYCSTQFQPCG